jgi:NAD-specific glutamate dehydrogenase
MSLDLAKWPVPRLVSALDDLAWTLNRLTQDMKLAAEWGNVDELSRMVDLGITMGWDLDEVYAQTAGKPARTTLSGVQTPGSFEECVELMRANVRAFKEKMDQRLEALKHADEEQKQQEEFLMRRLQEGLALALRNLRSKCKKGWPGRWSEALDEEFDPFMRIS